MDLIRITAGKVIPETVSLNADEVLLVVIVFLVLVNIIFLLVMKYKYTVGLKNRKLREFIEKLMLEKEEKRVKAIEKLLTTFVLTKIEASTPIPWKFQIE